MKKLIIFLTVVFSVEAVFAQYQSCAGDAHDSILPCGQYNVTNGTILAEDRVESTILNALRSGSANITSDNDSPSKRSQDVDTALIVEIIAGKTLQKMDADGTYSRLCIPKSVAITRQSVTIAYEGSDSVSNYTLTGIVQDGNNRRGWLLLRADTPPIRLTRDDTGILYTLKIPDHHALRLRRR